MARRVPELTRHCERLHCEVGAHPAHKDCGPIGRCVEQEHVPMGSQFLDAARWEALEGRAGAVLHASGAGGVKCVGARAVGIAQMLGDSKTTCIGGMLETKYTAAQAAPATSSSTITRLLPISLNKMRRSLMADASIDWVQKIEVL